jgi:hypothetical protein
LAFGVGPAALDVWEAMAEEAVAQSPLWAAALRPESEREALPVFSPLAPPALALGLETIYEGYLVHYGRPRLFAPPDRDTGVLLGDYLYAHGLVRVAERGEVAVVADLAELLSLCAQLRAESAPGDADDDGVLWAATFALVGSGDPELVAARTALRDAADPRPLASLAVRASGDEPVTGALALHRARLAV